MNGDSQLRFLKILLFSPEKIRSGGGVLVKGGTANEENSDDPG